MTALKYQSRRSSAADYENKAKMVTVEDRTVLTFDSTAETEITLQKSSRLVCKIVLLSNV